MEAVAAGAAADGGGVEPGGFDENVFCFGGDHGIPAAHDSGEGEGSVFIGHYEVVGFEDAVGAVEEFEFFAFLGETDDDAAFEFVEIEGMGGMAHAEEYEVGGVDGVGDLFLAELIEVLGDEARGWGDGDVAEDLGGEAAAEGRGFYGDGEGGDGCRFGRNTEILSCAPNEAHRLSDP